MNKIYMLSSLNLQIAHFNIFILLPYLKCAQLTHNVNGSLSLPTGMCSRGFTRHCHLIGHTAPMCTTLYRSYGADLHRSGYFYN